MDNDRPSKLNHIPRERAGPIPRQPVAGDDEATIPMRADDTQFGELFDHDSRRLAARVLRIALAVCSDGRLQGDAETRLAVLTDLQRLCLATEQEIDRLKREVEDEIVEQVRVDRRRARRRRDG